ncbi:MAG: hypothetical protein FJ006_09185, partial [Chloroflexi bacterium]|nr:hypothetical protein [Chloroflexota bacterium]
MEREKFPKSTLLSHKNIFLISAILFFFTVSFIVASKIKYRQELRRKAVQSLATDFYGTPINFLTVFGQPNFKEASEDTVTANKIFHAAGIVVDTSVRPNRIYVADSGNNRILGFESLGTCSNQTNTKCTNDTDCSGGTCVINIHKAADKIIGQSNDWSTTCNGDNNLGIYTHPSSSTLCFAGFPRVTNTGENWRKKNIDVDGQGNLYIPDDYNNRVLKFNQPFSQDTSGGKGDAIADFVWGQDDFNSNLINRGHGKDNPDNQSLYLSEGGFDHVSARGVSVDTNGNVWVADTFNYRVLRFARDTKAANLVLGQANFGAPDSSNCPASDLKTAPLNKMCTPILARIHPQTGDLFVLDAYPGGFRTRILVFTPPFSNGMAASKVIMPNQDRPITGYDYVFRATGLTFNTYKQGDYANGEVWVDEALGGLNRVSLLDQNGNILKVIGAIDKYHMGCDGGLYAQCNQEISKNFNLCWPGTISLDNANNIYIADENYHRIARYALPYQITNGCLPSTNGGLFDGDSGNSVSGYKWAGSVGTFIFANQLVVRDRYRYLVWNDYLTKPTGAKADLVVGQASDTVKVGNFLGGRGTHAIDDGNRLWTSNSSGKIVIYQLPFRGNDQPLVNFVKLYWADDQQEIDYSNFESGLAFDKQNKKVWAVDGKNHRLLRISNYNDFNNKLFVDMVIGQRNKAETKCNHDQEEKDGRAPTAESLCGPSYIEFDNFSNLYVVENAYECHGNDRITMFAADDIKNATSLFPGLSAKKVFVSQSFTQPRTCDVFNKLEEPFSPVSLAFNSRNQMVVGNDGYYGIHDERHLRQLWFYNDPLKKNDNGTFVQGQKPDAYLKLPMGAAGEINFDNQDNLIIQDHTWPRAWLINLERDPAWLVYLHGIPPSPTPRPTATPTPTPTRTPTPTPTRTPTPTPTRTPSPTPTRTPT